MDSENATPTRGRGGALFVWALVLLLIAYPLSPGPAFAIYRGYKDGVPKPVEWLFAPLEYAAENLPAVGSFYRWYMPLWGKK